MAYAVASIIEKNYRSLAQIGLIGPDKFLAIFRDESYGGGEEKAGHVIDKLIRSFQMPPFIHLAVNPGIQQDLPAESCWLEVDHSTA